MNSSSALKTRGRAVAIALATIVLSLALFVLAGCSSSDPKQLYESKCGTCHSLETVKNAQYSDAEQWGEVVKRMQAMTTTISDDDAAKITEYLAANQ